MKPQHPLPLDFHDLRRYQFRGKPAHPRPEAIAIKECQAKGSCKCMPPGAYKLPGNRINRATCEDRYKAAVQTILQRMGK